AEPGVVECEQRQQNREAEGAQHDAAGTGRGAVAAWRLISCRFGRGLRRGICWRTSRRMAGPRMAGPRMAGPRMACPRNAGLRKVGRWSVVGWSVGGASVARLSDGRRGACPVLRPADRAIDF